MSTGAEDLQALIDGPFLGLADRRQSRRRDGRFSPLPMGHAAPIGTGPEGESCKTCQHLHRVELSRAYLKCELMRASWTGGGKTDVRAGDAACRRWEAKA